MTASLPLHVCTHGPTACGEPLGVNAPAEQVMANASDVMRHADWCGHGLKVTQDGAGPVLVGTCVFTVAKQFGTQREQSEITDLDSPTLFG